MSFGAGLGFRRDLSKSLLSDSIRRPAFVELAPENWIDVGGYWGRCLEEVGERYSITAHGLSLSIGSPEDLDWEFLKGVRNFLRKFKIEIYSEHLSFCKYGNAHLYDLLPIPFTEDAIKHVVGRIKAVQDFLEIPIALENVSYYTPVGAELDEVSFISEIVCQSGCSLLLDVNNVFVNSFNHKYDAKEFIRRLPLDKVTYIHMAGHEQRAEDLIIDTHGQPIVDPVYDLFAWTTQFVSPVPVLLERDFNFPEYSELVMELDRLDEIMKFNWRKRNLIDDDDNLVAVV